MAGSTMIPKPWGHELIWAHTDAYAAKVLTIEAGKRLSLQLHRYKTETILVTEGKLIVHHGPSPDAIETTVLEAGQRFHVPPGLIHRFEAVEDTKVVEVSTPQLDDVVRLSDDYGREGSTEA